MDSRSSIVALPTMPGCPYAGSHGEVVLQENPVPRERVSIEAAEAGAAAPFVGAIARQPVEALDQPADGDRALHAGQHRTQAHMDARAEGEMTIGLAACIEAVGLRKLRRIAVG